MDPTLDAPVLNVEFDNVLPSSLNIDVTREIEAELDTPPIQIWIMGQVFQTVEDATKKGSPNSKTGGTKDRLKTVVMMLAPFPPLFSSAVFERALKMVVIDMNPVEADKLKQASSMGHRQILCC